MIEPARAGETIYPTLELAPPGIAASLNVAIRYLPTDTVVYGPTSAGIVERADADVTNTRSTYTATIVLPSGLVAGPYQVEWDAASMSGVVSDSLIVRPTPTFDGDAMATPDDVAAILHARLRERGGVAPDTFTTTTSPTRAQVETFLDLEAPLVLIDVGDVTDAALICASADVVRAAVRTLIAQRAAAAIELSYWPEEAASSGITAREFWRQIVEVDQPRVVAAAHECRLGEVAPDGDAGSQAPVYSFPDAGEVLAYTTGGIRRPFSREW